VNLDTSSLTGLVAHNPINPSQTLAIRAEINALINGRNMIVTDTALREFNVGLANLAGPTERANAQALLTRVIRVVDNPSQRISAVPTTQAFGANDRVIFGTGDNIGIETATGNRRAVNYIWQYVSGFMALVHTPARFRENFV
jgi:hypothetical protein